MGFRTILSVPLMREGVAIGAIQIRRTAALIFTPRQVALLETFADQAVIAIENVSLFSEVQARNRELTETLEQRTATGEILRVIRGSPTDVQPVFDTIVRSAVQLCDGLFSALFRYDGELIHQVAQHNFTPEALAHVRRIYPARPSRDHGSARAILERAIVHIPDVELDSEYQHRDLTRAVGFRSGLFVPMQKDGQPIGVIMVARAAPGPFSASQVELLETFADQAVIAIENVRLFTELDRRNRELTETLEQQTATGEILRVMSSSRTDVQPVFETIAQSAARLCEAFDVLVLRVDGDALRLVAHHGPMPAGDVPLHRGTLGGRTVIDRLVIHVDDLQAEADAFPEGSALARERGHRTTLSVPLMREGVAIGNIQVRRNEVRPFSDQQISLLQTFADQAVIAIENARLLTELQARTTQLTHSVQELHALGEVSRAVSSTLDLEAVLATIVNRAIELSGSHNGIVYEFDESTQSFHARATHQTSPELLAAIRAAPIRLGESAIGRAAVTREPVAVPDLEDEGEIVAARAREGLIREGMRSLLAIPLFREERLLGGLVIARRNKGVFSPEVIAMLQTFATQSALAIHNARLFHETERQKRYSEALVETSPVAIATLDLGGRGGRLESRGRAAVRVRAR